MTRSPKPKQPSSKPASPAKPNQLKVYLKEGDDPGLAEAQALTGPCVSNAIAFSMFMAGVYGEQDLMKLVEAMTEAGKKVKANDLSDAETMLMSQAMVLNGMFADLANRSASNRSAGYFDASQAYLKMAFRAQNQARMTLETLSTIKNPPVVYAKQANIAHGPQQVNNGGVSPTRTDEKDCQPSKLLEASNEQSMDSGTSGTASRSDSTMEAVAKVDRTKDT